VVEDAVAERLRAAGRAVVRGEAGLLTRVVVCLLGEALWLPVEGAFPVPGLAGPLDFGRPGFADRRRETLTILREAVLAGRARDLVRQTCGRLGGCSVTGWGTVPADPSELEQIVACFQPSVQWLLVETFLQEGWAALPGFPDLLVLDGPACILSECFPSRWPAGGRLIEVKGPGDSVRDGQKIWFDRLLQAGVPVELVEVAPPIKGAG
jgi:Fanconi-associated nuclease 1